MPSRRWEIRTFGALGPGVPSPSGIFGPGLSFKLMAFEIRDRTNPRERGLFYFGGPAIGIAGLGVWGVDGQEWTPFNTAEPVTLREFDGPARLTTMGLGLGAAVSLSYFTWYGVDLDQGSRLKDFLYADSVDLSGFSYGGGPQVEANTVPIGYSALAATQHADGGWVPVSRDLRYHSMVRAYVEADSPLLAGLKERFEHLGISTSAPQPLTPAAQAIEDGDKPDWVSISTVNISEDPELAPEMSPLVLDPAPEPSDQIVPAVPSNPMAPSPDLGNTATKTQIPAASDSPTQPDVWQPMAPDDTIDASQQNNASGAADGIQHSPGSGDASDPHTSDPSDRFRNASYPDGDPDPTGSDPEQQTCVYPDDQMSWEQSEQVSSPEAEETASSGSGGS
jgi:hypothetical protein